MTTDTKDNTEEQYWKEQLKDMEPDAIEKLIEDAKSALKKKRDKNLDEKPASSLTDDEFRARVERLGYKKG